MYLQYIWKQPCTLTYGLLPSCGSGQASVGEDQQTTLLFYNYFVTTKIECHFYQYLTMHFLKKKYHTGGKRWQKTTSWEFFPHPSLAKIVTTVQICVTMHLGAVRLKRGGLTARGGAYNSQQKRWCVCCFATATHVDQNIETLLMSQGFYSEIGSSAFHFVSA